jgi:formylglycine-generating enzyme required for sulfatase activity
MSRSSLALRVRAVLLACVCWSALVGSTKADVFHMPAGLTSLEMVPVGNLGNAPDAQTGYGAVPYTYAIGKYEITNAQWCEFLNAKASVNDPYGLYAGPFGDIDRTWSADHYVYTAKANRDNWPVSFVSFWDAARFCNWLHNAQGSGDTETGAYINIGSQSAFARQPGAKYFIPTENEWYKAAYYDPAKDGGAGYWDFPTRSDTAPTATTVADQLNVAPGSANYDHAVGGPTDVGSYNLKPSTSAYDTFDQGGNVMEWDEALIDSSSRGLRGGFWDSGAAGFLAASGRDSIYPTYENVFLGFRVASVPEPGSIMLAVAGSVFLLAYAWRRRGR